MSTTSISWNDVAGAVGGGTINPLTGVLTVTHYMYDLASLSYGVTTAATGYKKAYFSANGASRDTTGANMICSHVIGAYNGSGRTVESVCSEGAGYIYLQLSDTTLNGLTIKEYVVAQHNNNTPVIVVGKLATPVTYQLTPTEIRSLLGVNNIWADCGSVTELKYTRDLNLCINDIIARIEALEGASSSRSLSVSPSLTKSLTSDSDTAEGKTEEETEEETKEEAQNER